jgi:Protein of unknwon function (DUF3310)
MNKKQKIEKLLVTGMSAKDIAEQVKCTRDYVYQLRLKWNKEKQVVKRVVREDVRPVVQQVTTVTPNDIQVGGSHYKGQDIQPWDAIHAWGLGFFSGNVVKYVARHNQKGGVDDLRKARHYLDKLIELHTKVK